MIEKLDELDKELFLFINGFHNSFFDVVMFWISRTEFWIPLFILLIYLMYKKFKKRIIIALLFISLSILFADQLATSFFKPYFERSRPCHELALKGQVHTYKGCGGRYGFYSSHASNTFAVATFIFLMLYKRHNRISLLFLWAILVSYSRIYLGRHYPGDVLTGAVIGILIALLLYQLFKIIIEKTEPKPSVT